MFIPREAELLCVDPDDRQKPHVLSVYNVPDDYYTVNQYMARPQGLTPLFTTAFTWTPLDRPTLRAAAGLREPVPTAT